MPFSAKMGHKCPERAKELEMAAPCLGVWQDVSVGVRRLARRPIFATSVILLLGVAIGTNATLLSLMDALLFGPPPRVVHPETLVRVPNSWLMRPEQYSDLERDLRLLTVAGYSNLATLGLASGSETAPVQIRFVTSNYFQTLGVRPLLGRYFTEEEARPISASRNEETPDVVREEESGTDDLDALATAAVDTVAIVGYHFWRRHLDGSASAIGQTLRISGRTSTVIGIAPEGFFGIDPEPVDVWLPMQAEPRGGLWLIGRLLEGVSVDQARAELRARYPSDAPVLRGAGQSSATLVPVYKTLRSRLADLNVLVICMVASGLVLLLVACANTSILLVNRACQQRQEFAVRMQLGASRARIIQQLLAEVSVLLVGAVAGVGNPGLLDGVTGGNGCVRADAGGVGADAIR